MPQPKWSSTARLPARCWLPGGLLPPPAIAEGRAVARSLRRKMPLGSGRHWAGGTLPTAVLQCSSTGLQT